MHNKKKKVLLSLMLVGVWILVYLYLSHIVSINSGPAIQYDRGTEGQGFTLQPSINRANGCKDGDFGTTWSALNIARVNLNYHTQFD